MSSEDKCPLVRTEHEIEAVLEAQDCVIVLFFTSWCPFCARFLPIFARHVRQGGPFFLRVQDDDEKIADRYAIKIYPTVLFFKKGEVAGRLDGRAGIGLTEERLEEFIKSCPVD